MSLECCQQELVKVLGPSLPLRRTDYGIIDVKLDGRAGTDIHQLDLVISVRQIGGVEHWQSDRMQAGISAADL